MARELGLNPREFGSLANAHQKPWKRPLAEFIAHCYRKRFGRTTPEHMQSPEEVVKRVEGRHRERWERKASSAVLPTGPQRSDNGSNEKELDLFERSGQYVATVATNLQARVVPSGVIALAFRRPA